ncbi:MAG: hypothetical protein ACPGJV_00455 [Bacteriovoracaceae bacterium]
MQHTFRSCRALLILSSFLFAAKVSAQAQVLDGAFDFSITHPSCKLKVPQFNGIEILKNQLFKSLKSRGYIPSMMSNKRDIFKYDYYVQVELKKVPNKLYNKCKVTLRLKSAKNDRFLSSKDETLYKNTVTRQFPRITFEGNERCTRALRDTFIHIPKCKTK